jgi:aspartate-semialdehyde dehydrogenase
MMSRRIPVAVLGATGSVGQRFVQLLADHPWFELAVLASSEQRVGKTYAETCHWTLPVPMPEKAAGMTVVDSIPEAVDVPLAFSALPSGVAKEKEPLFAQAGIAVCTNAGAYRQEPDVPILLPEVNPTHAGLIPIQRRNRGWSGFIATNPNCTSTGATVALKALLETFGVHKVFIVSLQALSGAGYPGVPSMDIVDNVIPFISNEEPKLQWEPLKMLGTMAGEQIELADIAISAHCNRVAVSDGHLVCMSVELGQPVEPAQAAKVLAAYQAPPESRELPSCPSPVIVVTDRDDRPQPRLDRMTGNGMTTVVGRLREDPILQLKFIVLSHNTIRGAAGGSIFNAELLVDQGLIG